MSTAFWEKLLCWGATLAICLLLWWGLIELGSWVLQIAHWWAQ